MTTPPDEPEDWPAYALPPQQPPPHQPPPPEYPPYYYGPYNGPYYGPYNGPPGYPYPPPQVPPSASRISIGLVFAGIAVWMIFNAVVAFVAFVAADGATSSNSVLAGAALGLALGAFGGGGGLLLVRNKYARGLGLGLMIGWALMSLFTVGFCTGINPELYSQ